jgi:hypothetical protein
VLQAEYRGYRKVHETFKKRDAEQHLLKEAKAKFDVDAHPDTIRDRVIKPVEEADAVEK